MRYARGVRYTCSAGTALATHADDTSTAPFPSSTTTAIITLPNSQLTAAKAHQALHLGQLHARERALFLPVSVVASLNAPACMAVHAVQAASAEGGYSRRRTRRRLAATCRGLASAGVPAGMQEAGHGSACPCTTYSSIREAWLLMSYGEV